MMTTEHRGVYFTVSLAEHVITLFYSCSYVALNLFYI